MWTSQQSASQRQHGCERLDKTLMLAFADNKACHAFEATPCRFQLIGFACSLKAEHTAMLSPIPLFSKYADCKTRLASANPAIYGGTLLVFHDS